MGNQFTVVLTSRSLSSSNSEDASNASDLFFLGLAEALSSFGDVVVASTAIEAVCEGNGFRVVPRHEVAEHIIRGRGVLIGQGYDPTLLVNDRFLAWRLGLRHAIYVYDHHSGATRGWRLPKRTAASLYFNAGLLLLCAADHILVVNARCKQRLPRLVRHKVILTAIGTNRVSGPVARRRTRGLVVVAGSLTHQNVILELMDAFALIDSLDATLEIFGDGPLREQVAEKAGKLCNVNYRGRRPHSEISAAMGSAWLVAALRKSDPVLDDYAFPSKLVECLSSGAVTLVSPPSILPGAERISITSGCLTPSQLKVVIERGLAMSAAEHRDMAERAFGYVRSEFSWSLVAEDLYKSLSSRGLKKWGSG